ncbi:MAG: hypothetical protein GXY64_08400 [Bacteroidales bacterium]|nr:hypothetical protein [Bacteroidales bacterium]
MTERTCQVGDAYYSLSLEALLQNQHPLVRIKFEDSEISHPTHIHQGERINIDACKGETVWISLPLEFSNHRSTFQALTNNASTANEQWCDDQRTMVQVPLNHACVFGPTSIPSKNLFNSLYINKT